jgi:uncharacterized membrane-anchored protein YjiN (DUF445 family)
MTEKDLDLATINKLIKRNVKQALREFIASSFLEDIMAEPYKKTDEREVTDEELMQYLYWWSAARNKKITERMRILNEENETLREELFNIDSII